MEKNIGKTGRIIRSIIGIVAIYLGYTISPWFYLLTAFALFTVATSHCIPYSWFKKITAKKK